MFIKVDDKWPALSFTKILISKRNLTEIDNINLSKFKK